MTKGDRIDGWKAIGAHFGRDRTTAIRWAKERGLPVHALPGGQTRTIYALRSELEAWARRGETLPPSAPPPELAALPQSKGRSVGRSALLVALPAALALAAALLPVPRSPPSSALPVRPEVAALYLRARDDWATRSAGGLRTAIEQLREVVRKEPRFAPAHAALADAYLLAREHGGLADLPAYRAAQAAATRALTLDPRLAAAQRALGFIAYWRDGDRALTRRRFAQALRLEPDDAQTHFWYGNILADNGEFRPAFREFDRARLLDPGSLPIRTDRAWALWQAGREEEAGAELAAVLAADANSEEAHDCLSVIRLARRDLRGYVEELAVRARLRGSDELSAHVRVLQARLAQGGRRGILEAILARALAERAEQHHTRAWPAFAASLAGRRDVLMRLLHEADRRDERWSEAGYLGRLRQRFAADAPIAALLAQRVPPLIES